MRATSVQILAALSLTMLCAHAAGCGGSDDTNSAAAPSGTGGNSGSDDAQGGSVNGGKAGTSSAGKAGASGHPGGSSGKGGASGTGAGGAGVAGKGGQTSQGGKGGMASAGGPGTGGASAGSTNVGGTSSVGGMGVAGGQAGMTSAGGMGTAGSAIGGPRVGDFIGLNGFIDDPLDKLAAIGNVREYHNWGWIEDNFAAGPAYPDNQCTFMNFNGWDWDVFFAGLQSMGVSGFPAVQGGEPWVNNSAIPPVDGGADKTLAASYAAHADAMYQIAARYGATKVDDAKLKLKSTQSRSSGLGTVQYYENFNEQDNAAAFTGDAFAAMSSADYDGDQGKLGATFGIKSADPSAKLVMGGLSGAYNPSISWLQSITDYLDAMRTWSAAHRGGSFPADVVNVHYYSFGPSGAALSPEDDGVQEKLAGVVAYRDQNLPGKEVWWTEFGYDTYEKSVLHVPAIGGNSAFVVQGQWLVRELLAGLAAGLDRATLYILRDGCLTTDAACHPEIQFATAGITTVKGQWTPKASWFFLATFRSRLASMSYGGEVASGASDVRVAQFRDPATGAGAYVLWAPTSNGTVHTGYSLAVASAATTASAVALVDQMANGAETPLPLSNNAVTLDVSETPTIVLVDSLP